MPDDVLYFEDLYRKDNPMLTVAEVEAIDDLFTIMRLINYETLTTEQDACFAIHDRIMEESMMREEYTKFYITVERKQTMLVWFNKLCEYCIENDQIPDEFIDRFREGIESGEITKTEFVDLLENIAEPDSFAIKLLSDINWTDGLSDKLCTCLYQEQYYIDYVCNQVLSNETGVDFFDENIQKSILDNAEWIYRNAGNSFLQIRMNILKNSKLIHIYLLLFESPFPFVSQEEIYLIRSYKDVILILEKRGLEEEQLPLVAVYFNREYRNPAGTYDIVQYVISLDMPQAYKLFYLLKQNKLPYSRMAAKRFNEMNKKFYDKFEMEHSADERLKFMIIIGKAVPIMEKELYNLFEDDDKMINKYNSFINKLPNINEETIENICNFNTFYSYSDPINEKLFQYAKYQQYVVSKTLGNAKFEMEEDKLDVLADTYIYVYNQSVLNNTRKYMAKNEQFGAWLQKKEAYVDLGDKITRYANVKQSVKLLQYIFKCLEDEKLTVYLSSIVGFDGYDSARFFVKTIVEQKYLLSQTEIYNNCHEKLVDPGLKGWYTKSYKQERKK